MDHEGRGGDLAEARSDRLAAVDHPVVGHARRDVHGAIEDATGELTQARFVGRIRARCGPLAGDDVVDHRRAVQPVRLRWRLGEERAKLVRHGREVGIAGATWSAGAGRDQGE
jgi:hypothetical protein